jgi:GntR family transcriptional repressor for pyruvate dehydrogenase complex
MDQWLERLEAFKPPTRERLIDKVASQIKDFIFSHNIKVGHKLPSERELARQFEVSRMVVSDALRSLERSGLVEIRIGSAGGAFVTYDVYLPLFQTMHDLLKGGRLSMHHFCEARKGIESMGISLATEKVTARDIAYLRKLHQKMIEHLESGDRTSLKADNLVFHLAIAQISGNPIITLMVHSLIKLIDATYPYTADYRRFASGQLQRHESIIQALEAKDVQRGVEMIGLDADFMRKLKRAKPEHRKRKNLL